MNSMTHIKWDDIKDKRSNIGQYFTSRAKTNIECPKCGELIYKRTDITLTTHPAMYQYECDGCGWVGYAHT